MNRKERYYDCKSRGICVACHKNQSVDGLVRCEVCREKQRNHDKRNQSNRSRRGLQQYHERKANGMCTKCGKNKSIKKQTLCESCRHKKMSRTTVEERTRYKRLMYHKHKADGRCVKCGRKKTTRNVLCVSCREKQKRETKRIKIRKSLNGICSECSSPVSNENRRYCDKHRIENLERRRLRYHRNKVFCGTHRLCEQCRESLIDGETRFCTRCRETLNASRRDRYQEAALMGICIRCYVESVEPGYATCSVCRLKMSKQLSRVKA